MRSSRRNGRLNKRKESIQASGSISTLDTRTGGSVGRIRPVLAGLSALPIIVISMIVGFSAQAQRQTPYTPARGRGVTAVDRGGARRATRLGAERGAQRRGPTGADAPGRRGAAEARRAAPSARAARAVAGARGRGAAPSVTGGKGAFDAFKQHPVKYPRIGDEGKRILKLDAQDLSVEQFLQRLSLTTGWTIIPTQNVTGNVTGWLSDISVSDALKVLEINGFYYEKKGDIFYVMSHDEYYAREYGAMSKEEFTVDHAYLSDVRSVLASFQSQEGRMVADPRTGKLLVIDTDDNIKFMREVLNSLDVKLEAVWFQLKYIEADELLRHIEPVLSERGTVETDLRTNTLTVTDVPERIEKVKPIIAELDVELAKETFPIEFAKPGDVKSAIERFLPDTTLVTVDSRTRQLTVETLPDSVADARRIVGELDKRLKQVAIEAYIVSANTQRVRELGVNWAYFDETADLIAAGYAPEALDFAIGGVLIGRTETDSTHLGAVVSMLATDSDAEILANPHVVVSDRQPALFRNVTNEPYQEGGYGTAGGGIESRYYVPMSIKFVQVGTTLDVTPTIQDDSWVELDISAKDSSAELRVIVSGDLKTTVPVETENSVSTKVLVRSGETIVIGGLRSDSASRSVDKVPFFGDIPVLGHLFKSTTRRTGDKELLIFIRPEIIEEADAEDGRLAAEIEQTLRKHILESDRQPFDLGGKQKPFIQRYPDGKQGGGVPPFVPRYPRPADVAGKGDAVNDN